MSSTPTELLVIPQHLDAVDAAEYAEQYGVAFVEPARAERMEVGRMCGRLLHTRQGLSDTYTRLGVTLSKPAVFYTPDLVLAEPPTPQQISQINEQETAAVARYCVNVQADLAQVPIAESCEPMVHLPTLFSDVHTPISFSEAPFHTACGDWAGKDREFWVREGVAYRLLLMADLLLSQNAQLHIEDAFRPVGVQEGLFKRRVDWTVRDHPEWTDEAIIAEAQSKTAVKPRLASHKGGAAIDARLRDLTTGELLDFGHNYPDGGALVFPRTPFITAEQWRNRQLFQVAAGLSDLTLYVGEDWHVSYGDNLASLSERGFVRPDYVARYGPIKDFDRTTGQITATYTEGEMDQVFDYDLNRTV
ncbi:MAG TPA: M15 family metallopeptidase [Candidatus Saccharimonadales bacterium]|nr:M15 family metallopeptidase [Candidatus Saccharimonadales bacterium]